MWKYNDENFPNREYAYFQFGIQRTGTTVIDRVIKDTWGYWKANDAFPNDIQIRPPAYHKYVWKHAIEFPDHFEKGSPTVLVYKNPYTWAESMAFRKGSGNGGWGFTYGHEADEFMYPQPNHWNTISVPGQGTTNIGQIMYTYQHWFNTWLPYAKEYPDSTVIVRYEDFLVPEKREKIFEEMCDKFGWDRSKIETMSVPNHVGSSQPMTQERIDYYVKGHPTDERLFALNGRYIKSIRDILGAEFIESLGYEVL